MITTWLVLFKLKIDDPLDATAGVCLGDKGCNGYSGWDRLHDYHVAASL